LQQPEIQPLKKKDVSIFFSKFNKRNHSGTVFSLYRIKKYTMKKIIQYVMMASIFAACNSKSNLDTNKDVVLTDTSGMYKSNIMTDTGSVIQATSLNAAAANKPVVINNYYGTTPKSSTTRRTGSGTYANSGTSRSTGSSTTVTRKRGWSHAAKNAVIGGAGGAVVGAVVSKHKGTGAIIGGVVGAAGGYILGRSKDKKEGRY
jgi:hypothetical protein